jgi:hypothetical protein
MANDKQKIFQQAKDAITQNKLFFIEDVVAFLPIAKKTYYEYYPIGSDESNELKELLEVNKIKIKSSMRSKWYKSTAPALQLALYKLIAMPEEIKALQMNYTDHTTNGKDITSPIKWVDGTAE